MTYTSIPFLRDKEDDIIIGTGIGADDLSNPLKVQIGDMWIFRKGNNGENITREWNIGARITLWQFDHETPPRMKTNVLFGCVEPPERS
ncbi:MAG: hypothetical protein GDA52_04800 [Rhodobacteraceae bacterium]|nr:hypothetical protein [Paracoccaceae bacterium]